MECAHPPCCKVSCIRNTCETSACCRQAGRVGTRWFAENRKTVMLVSAFLSFVCIILNLVAVVALSTKSSDVMATAWTYGEGENDLNLFVGLKSIVADNDGKITNTKWSDADCKQDFCSDCKSACDATEVAAIMALITSIPTFQTDLQRSTVPGDLNCQKLLAIITGIIGFLTTLSSLSSYSAGCYANLPDQLAMPGGHVDMTWRHGPGFACILVATLLKPLNVISHFFLPTPEEKNRRKNEVALSTDAKYDEIEKL